MRLPMCKRVHYIVIIGTLLSIYLCYSPFSDYDDLNQKTSEVHKKDTTLKYILQWTKPDTIPFERWGHGQTRFILLNCEVNTCYVTSNRSYLKSVTDFDAIAFHGPEIVNYIPGPQERSLHQKYVFVSIESSHYYPICDKRYDDYFNWTWTYKLGSDEPYGYITVRDSKGNIIGPKETMHWMDVESMDPINDTLKLSLDRKKKPVAWFVSNCNSKSEREIMVKHLQRELYKYSLKIDIFGNCGSNKCPLGMITDCMKMIKRDYYFYLSLENSFAEDYVTEKLLTALKNDAIPIVFGAANYTRFMPEGIYLHGGKLKPEELAREMFDIIQDKERYYSFFKWRNHYSYHYREESPETDDHCKMCAMLHDQAATNKTTIYKEFRKWWNTAAGKC